MTNTKAKLEFVWAMARNTRATVRQCEALMRYAATLQRLAEDDCNIATDDEGLAARESKRRQMRGRIRAVCDDIGKQHTDLCYRRNECACPAEHVPIPVFSGDPRGAVLKIRVPSGYTNDWGKEGICVPS